MAKLDERAKTLGIDLSVNLAGIRLSNPILPASGTFMPEESGQFYDISELGAAVTKGVAPVPWAGNETPRIAEVYGGILNSVGLQNPGVDAYIENDMKYLADMGMKIITNVAGHSVEDYVQVVEKLADRDEISMFEVNISCPNVSAGGMSFGTDPEMAAEVVRAVRRLTRKPLFFKLTPNVTDITEIAKAVEAEGADGVTLINTLLGMHIDVKRRRATMARKVGGMSGPAVKPVALRMVWQVANAVKIPVIGVGGISTGTDVVEFLAAGATAVEVGTAALADPLAIPRIKSELIDYMNENRFEKISEMKHAFEI
ncbi:MAG: dihydroorotate dehydrogenase [Clostridia bacterium]|nr:dihydroorotate dehydrogenase [Clostridia bacterium]